MQNILPIYKYELPLQKRNDMPTCAETRPKRIKVTVRIKEGNLLTAKREAARRNMSLNAYVVSLLEKEMVRAEKGLITD